MSISSLTPATGVSTSGRPTALRASFFQRWSAYATNGHGGNVELRNLDPISFRFSLLRVFDPATPTRVIDEVESHYKLALDTRKHGLNRN